MGRGGADTLWTRNGVTSAWRAGPNTSSATQTRGSGTFKGPCAPGADPLSVIRGMTIAGYLFSSPGASSTSGACRDLSSLSGQVTPASAT